MIFLSNVLLLQPQKFCATFCPIFVAHFYFLCYTPFLCYKRCYFVLHFSVRMFHFFDFVSQFNSVSNDLRSRFFVPKCHCFEFPKVILSDSQREMHVLRGLILPDFHLLSPPQTVLFLPSNRSLYSRKPLLACLAHCLQLCNDLIYIHL